MIYNDIFVTTINTIPNPIIVVDRGSIIHCNRNFLSFFNYENIEEFIKDNSDIGNLFLEEEGYFSLSQIDENILWTDYIYENLKILPLVSMLDKDKIARKFKIAINKLQGYEDHYLVVFTDITAIENEKKLLEQKAHTDPLTNICNRQMFNKIMITEKENKKRYGDSLSLIMFDIDHFKKINDTYGHNVGDKVLITLTKLISKHLRTNDIFARWGGEEFMILLPRTDIQTAYYKAQELRETIKEYSDDTIPKITVSFGVTEVLNSDQEQSEFVRVDKALYKAKIKRNDVVKILDKEL